VADHRDTDSPQSTDNRCEARHLFDFARPVEGNVRPVKRLKVLDGHEFEAGRVNGSA
jgi:hypothetical protein